MKINNIWVYGVGGVGGYFAGHNDRDCITGRKKGIDLAGDVVDSSLAKAGNFPFETKTSLQRDVETKGARNEADLFGGTIIRAGKMLGIETPITRSVYERLQRAVCTS